VARLDPRGLALFARVVVLAGLGLAAAAVLRPAGDDSPTPYQAGSIATAAVLAQGRLNILSRAGARDLNPLSDALARGTFPAPDTIYHWSAAVRPVKRKPDVYDVTVTVAGHGAAYKLETRLYRPR